MTSAADPDIAVTTLQRAGTERFQSLRRELGVRSFGMNLIRLAPRQRGRIHAHDHQEEVYLVLDGELTRATVRHQLVNAGTEPLILLALGAAGDHVGRDGHAWPSWDAPGAGQPPPEIPLPEDPPEA